MKVLQLMSIGFVFTCVALQGEIQLPLDIQKVERIKDRDTVTYKSFVDSDVRHTCTKSKEGVISCTERRKRPSGVVVRYPISDDYYDALVEREWLFRPKIWTPTPSAE